MAAVERYQAVALGSPRHGPLLWPADDLQPQILCILWLDARNALLIIHKCPA
jgi:hypothetical protein